MGEFFAKISGQFTASLVLSSLFPVLLFLAALTLVVLPISPYGHDFTDAMKDPKLWQDHASVALVLTLVVLVLSVLLFNMNTPIIRLYEGYPWQHSWIGGLLIRRSQRRRDAADLLEKRIERLRLEARLAGIAIDAAELSLVQGRLSGATDVQRHLLLPTRLGNTIRAFELYPQHQYAMDAVNLWPRLQPLIDSNLAQTMDSVKTSFDFMIHCSFLSAVLAVLAGAGGLYWKLSTFSWLDAWFLWTIAFGLMSYLLYLASIRRAVDWGSQVKAAFDLHRLSLLTKLGYEVKPTSLNDERRIWQNVNYRLLFAGDPNYPDLPYAVPGSLVVEPSDTVVDITREAAIQPDGSIEITLWVENKDTAGLRASRVNVREQLPAGMVYIPPAQVDKQTAKLCSIDPLMIDIGPLSYKQRKQVTYRIRKAAP